MNLPAVFATALKHYLPNTATARLSQAEAERRDILRAFPSEQWATLPLTRYALGTNQPEPTFCYWLEFKSKALGGMGGGTASKHVIYKNKDSEWHYPAQFAEVEAAWVALRGAFVQALANARDNRWAEMDAISLLREKAVLVKALHIYFPSRILPIVSRAHLMHFLRAFDVAESSVRD